MQAYATTARRLPRERLSVLDLPSPNTGSPISVPTERDPDLLDGLLGQIADLVVDRLVERTQPSGEQQSARWMGAREAAAYLGMHRDTLRKLAAQRAIPAHQDGPRCKLYFNRDELDDWRRAARPRLRAA